MWQLKTLEKKERDNVKIIFGSVVLALFLIFGFIFLNFFFLSPKAIASNTPESLVDLKGRASVEFNKPVDRNKISYSISPDVQGALSFEQGFMQSHLYKRVVFTPDTFFKPNQEYKLTIKNINSIYGSGPTDDYIISFKTKDIPKIKSYSITNNAENISPDVQIEAFLDQSNNGIVDFDFKLDPPVEFMTEFIGQDQKYIIKPKTALLQGQNYKLTASRKIFGQNSTDIPLSINFKVKNAPGIKTFSPSGSNVLTSVSGFSVVFTEKMDQQSILNNISITPAVKGAWKWQDELTLIYNASEKLSYGTGYKIAVKQGAQDSVGGFIASDIVLSFTTIGKVEVIGFTPKNNATETPTNSTIKVQFNQEVDHASAERLFSIEPRVAGVFSWQNNLMFFKPNNLLSSDSNYKINLEKGIKSINGLDSDRTFGSSFSTPISSTILSVALDYQDRALSCEAAALKMALNYKGAMVSENDIMSAVGYDSTIHNGNVWGDPDTAFVGDINGKQNSTGYGVYFGPIARAASNWRQTKGFSGGSASDLAREITAGNPVVIWGTIGTSYSDSWYTPDGKKVNTWKGEHARTVIGFRGSVNDPKEFIINDPYAGKLTWSTSKLLSDWSRFNNSGVVVY